MAMNVDTQLLFACTTVETIISKTKPDMTTIYIECMDYLVSHAEKLDVSNMDNSGKKVSVVETNFMDSYVQDDTHHEEAADIAA